MAIYHFSAKIISRANGSSALASAAYRSASRLHDERLDRSHDFTTKSGVVHSVVMTPDGVPDELREREGLWNAVEGCETRKDAQLAREVEFAIPRELTREQGIELARDFVQAEFVGRGMIADLNVHWDMGADGQFKPHAHVMLTMRSVNENGFGAKVREWNRTERLEHWREAWAAQVNERLADLGIAARIDYRSLKDQGIELEPQHKIGPAAARMAGEGLEADRLEEHRQIARANGERIIANPDIALDAITRTQATFTWRDLALLVHRHSDGLDQFQAVMNAVEGADNLVRLGRDGRSEERFTSREMIELEQRLYREAQNLADRTSHCLPEDRAEAVLDRAKEDGFVLTREQQNALSHIVEGNDLSILLGYAGSGKSVLLGMAREAWEEEGYRVRGVALSGIAAENLESSSGIVSRTIASMEHQWANDRERLTEKDVLVVDEAGMVGSRQLERILGEAERQGAKVVLVGDPEQLQAIEAGAAFRSLTERHAHVEMREVRRQHEGWQREATRQLATGRTAEAMETYRDHGQVQPAQSREEARQNLVEGWDQDRRQLPGKSRIILTHTNEEVGLLNGQARTRLMEAGELGAEVTVQVERGRRDFAPGDRVMFLKNDRELGVKNGSLGTVETVTAKRMSVRLDGDRSVAFDLKDYAHLDHGYAATIHKAQGVTVDRTYVLATPGLDRHAAYVALSRHREQAVLHYGRDDFADDARLARVLSRERAKDMASDYGQDIAGDNSEPRASRPVDDRPAEHGREGVGREAVDGERSTRDRERAARPEPPKEPAVEHRELTARRDPAAGEQAPKPEREQMRGAMGPQQGVEGADTARQVSSPATERASEQGRKPSIFASFRPMPKAADQSREVRRPDLEHAASQNHAVRNYARSVRDISRMEELNLPVLPHQHQAHERARAALEAVRPKGARDLDSAFAANPGLVGEAADGRTRGAIRAMQVEAEIRTNPALRADRFVARWQDLELKREGFHRSGDMQSARSIKATMGEMARGLEQDAQVESLLRSRSKELGIPMEMGRSPGHSMMDYLGLGRSRGLSL